MSTLSHPTEQKLVFKLKPLSKESVEGAITKAEQYRLLNQPSLAESICRDILATDPQHQKATVILLLSLTDQFGQSVPSAGLESLELARGLNDAYSKAYYLGIVHERQGLAAQQSSVPGSNFDACEWYLEAMEFYDEANNIRPSGNDDAILRWNTCARIIMKSNLMLRPKDDREPILE